jgi:hypothetical protein
MRLAARDVELTLYLSFCNTSMYQTCWRSSEVLLGSGRLLEPRSRWYRLLRDSYMICDSHKTGTGITR